MFGMAREFPAAESTPFYPRSPYGAAKVYAHWVAVTTEGVRDVRLQRHPVQPRVPRRGGEASSPGRSRSRPPRSSSAQEPARARNLERSGTGLREGTTSRRLWLMLQQPSPTITSSRRAGPQRPGVLRARLRPRRARLARAVGDRPPVPAPHEVDHLVGDPSKARTRLGWTRGRASRSWSAHGGRRLENAPSRRRPGRVTKEEGPMAAEIDRMPHLREPNLSPVLDSARWR